MHKNIIKLPVFSSSKSLFASPSYITKYGCPKKISDLINHACLLNIKDSTDLSWEFSENEKIRINPRYITDSTDNLVKPAIDGLGIIWVSKDLVQNELNVGELIEIELDIVTPPLNFYIYYKPVSRASNIRLLSDFLVKGLQKNCNRSVEGISTP